MLLKVKKCPEGNHLHKWQDAQEPDGVWTDVPSGQRPTSVYVREVFLTLRPAEIEEGPAKLNPYLISRW